MKNKSLIFLCLIILFSGFFVQAQRKSKLPRVTVKANHVKPSHQNQAQGAVHNLTSHTFLGTEVEKKEEYSIVLSELAEVPHHVNRVSKEISYVNYVAKPILNKTNRTILNNSKKRIPYSFSGSILKTHARLFHVKEVEKTAIEVSVLLLILFYILGVVFTVLCILALLLWNNATMFIVFLILAILFSTAGSIILTLWQMGVI